MDSFGLAGVTSGLSAWARAIWGERLKTRVPAITPALVAAIERESTARLAARDLERDPEATHYHRLLVLLGELRKAAAGAAGDRAVCGAFARRMAHRDYLLQLAEGDLAADAPPAISLAVAEGLQV
jgi:hypothetical protein